MLPEKPKQERPRQARPKQKLWLAVGITLGIIILIWLSLLPHTWKIISAQGAKNIWPSLKFDAQASIAQLQQSMTDLLAQTNTNTNATNENTNMVIISNPNNLSPEEIQVMEKDLFPEQNHD